MRRNSSKLIYDIQKASLLKRFSAFLLDIILLVIVATGVAALVSVISGYDGYYNQVQDEVTRVNKAYGVDITKSKEEAERVYDVATYAKYLDAYAEFQQKAAKPYGIMISLSIVMVSVGLFVAFLALEFVVPLFLKNGQTVGKKVFKIGVIMNVGVRVTTFALFVRTVFGKYVVETMLPVMGLFLIMFNIAPFLGLVMIAGILVAQVTLLIVNKNHCLLHDLAAGTVAVDLSTQMVFDTMDDLVDYKTKLQAEQAAHSPY